MKCGECGSTKVQKFEGKNEGYCPICKKPVALAEEKQNEKMRVFSATVMTGIPMLSIG